jgi:hypothetical protein
VIRYLRICSSFLFLSIAASGFPEGEVLPETEPLSPGQYEVLKEFESDPLDPAEAGIDDYMDIPGFPRSLARRIVKLAAENERGWFGRLSLKQRETLLCYRRWIDIPAWETDPLEAEFRYSRSCKERGNNDRVYLSSSAGNWKARFRAERRDSRERITFFAGSDMFSGRLKVYGGDFSCHIPLGLMFSSLSFSYPFSSGYPFGRSRWISSGARFYGNPVRGGAMLLDTGPFRSVAFAGFRRGYRFRYRRNVSSGGAIRFSRGRIKAGGSVSFGAERKLNGIYFMYSNGTVDIGFEAAAGNIPGGAWAGGIRYRTGNIRLGALLYSCSGGFRSEFGRIPGTGGSVSGEKRGLAASLRGRLPCGIDAGFAVDGTIRRIYHLLYQRISVRFRLDGKSGRTKGSLQWKSFSKGRDRLAPYPGSPLYECEMAGNIKSVITVKLSGMIGMRASLCYLYGEEEGVMLYPLLRLKFSGGAFQAELGSAVYRSLKGDGVFYAFTPAVRGAYPWERLGGTGRCLTMRMKVELFGFSIFLVLGEESGSGRSMDTQIIAEF